MCVILEDFNLILDNDIHIINASRAFEILESEVTEDQRLDTKIAFFLSLYEEKELQCVSY